MELTQFLVRELLDYDPETGALTWRMRGQKWFSSARAWKAWNNRFADHVTATAQGTYGYLLVGVLGRKYRTHRLIWLWMMGDWPTDQIDHLNHNRADNRWCNLRLVTHAENGKNQSIRVTNTSGAMGVWWDSKRNSWQAYIDASGRRIHLGRYTTKTDAIIARKAAERAHGYHENHGAAQ